MIGQDFHNHTTFCDGHADPETMVKTAIQRGITRLGLLIHSYTFFDESYCASKDAPAKFQVAIAALKEKYRGQIELYCGVEQDYYSAEPTDGFDYVIGSVHYLHRGDEYPPIDDSREHTLAIVRDYYGGDWYSYAEDYFRTAADVAEKIRPNIIGHFDLVAKYNGEGDLFDESHPRYVAAWQAAADRLLTYGIPFEINLGGMLRAGRHEPYPTPAIQRYLAAHGARVLLSGDCHTAEALGVGFEEWEKAAVDAGFRPEQWVELRF
ncbi:MAG: histidinol-phosphatase HisJ family protein [Clostridia bacterium]|nr:histidinol-phosphatase HisJ family protein [Clostridia bacterium]